MALIKCKECGGKMSDKAIACPHCGFQSEFSDAISETIINAQIQAEIHKSYELEMKKFKIKIKQLIMFAVGLGIILGLVAFLMEGVAIKFGMIGVWILSVMILYYPFVKRNGSIIGGIVITIALAISLSIIFALSMSLASQSIMATVIVAAAWVVITIAIIVYPIIDISKDIKRIKMLKQ